MSACADSGITVGIVENHPVSAEGLANRLSVAGFTVVPPVQDVPELEAVPLPDVVVCDLHLSETAGGDAVARLVALGCRVLATSGVATPEESLDAVARGASGFVEKRSRAEAFVEAVRTIASGHCYADPYLARYLLDDADRRALAADDIGPGDRALLRALAQGDLLEEVADRGGRTVPDLRAQLDRILDAGRRRRLMYRPTPREEQVIRLVGGLGWTDIQAAREMGISPKRVGEILTSVRDKYRSGHPQVGNIKPRTAAMLWAKDLGY